MSQLRDARRRPSGENARAWTEPDGGANRFDRGRLERVSHPANDHEPPPFWCDIPEQRGVTRPLARSHVHPADVGLAEERPLGLERAADGEEG